MNAVAGTRLRIFSGMGVYQVPAEQDQFRPLYDQARSTEGIEYIGPVGQSRLANELTGATALAFPSTFAETSCITVIEAMAVGAAVITTALGALPETTGGFCHPMEPQTDKAKLAEDFAAKTIEALRDMRRDPAAETARRGERMKYVREKYSWPARAKEWETWLSKGRAAKAVRSSRAVSAEMRRLCRFREAILLRSIVPRGFTSVYEIRDPPDHLRLNQQRRVSLVRDFQEFETARRARIAASVSAERRSELAPRTTIVGAPASASNSFQRTGSGCSRSMLSSVRAIRTS